MIKQQTKNEILEMWDSGDYTKADIARRVGVAWTTVHHHIENRNTAWSTRLHPEKARCLAWMEADPSLTSIQIQDKLREKHRRIPGASTITRWRQEVGIEYRRKKQVKFTESMKIILFPVDYPGFLLRTPQGVVVKRSPRLSGGGHIYAIFDNKRGQCNTFARNLETFFVWLENYLQAKLIIYTEHDGQLERVTEEDDDLFSQRRAA